MIKIIITLLTAFSAFTTHAGNRTILRSVSSDLESSFQMFKAGNRTVLRSTSSDLPIHSGYIKVGNRTIVSFTQKDITPEFLDLISSAILENADYIRLKSLTQNFVKIEFKISGEVFTLKIDTHSFQLLDEGLIKTIYYETDSENALVEI